MALAAPLWLPAQAPADPLAPLEEAAAARRAGGTEKASASLAALLSESGQTGTAAALALGNLRLERADAAGAESPLRQCYGARGLMQPYAGLLLARCLHGLGKDEEALQTLLELPGQAPSAAFAPRATRLRADVLRALGRPHEEAELWRRLSQPGGDSRREEAFFRLAEALDRAGRSAEAARAYEAIAFERLSSPYLRPARHALARLDATGRVPARRLKTPEALRYTDRLLKSGHAPDALEVLTAIPPDALSGDAALDAAFLRVSTLYALRDNAGAVAEADALWDMAGPCPVALQAQLRAGWALLRVPDRPGIALRVQRVLAHAGKDEATRAEAHLLSGTAAYVLGDWAGAAQAFEAQEGLRAGSGTLASGLYKRAWCEFMRGNFSSARALFQRTAQRYRQEGYRPPAVYWAARCSLLAGDLEAGFKDLRALATAQPGFWSQSAKEFLVAAGELPPSPAESADLPPRWPEALRGPEAELARLLDLCGLEEEAAEALEPLYRRHPKDAQVGQIYALLLAESGREDEAAAVLSRSPWRSSDRPETRALALRVRRAAPGLELCREAAAREKVPLPLLLAIIRQESGFDPEAYSPAGAAGLMQLMPETADSMAKELGKPPPSPEALLEPATNVRLGTRYLAGLLRALPAAQAVASYNAGEDVVSVWAASFKAQEAEQFMAMIPYLETRRYVARVLYEERMYRKAYGNGGEVRKLGG